MSGFKGRGMDLGAGVKRSPEVARAKWTKLRVTNKWKEFFLHSHMYNHFLLGVG